ncbi:MAG: hypothetical protein HN580_09595 [Deltaproteobacteria bacterium]|jgi:hypothetical protein|nr:hypothetical protein [Deltaproteobacteria bacterium]MBT4266494.1 hypothetical protein [Deltaproteobacteria bacterium]MBT4637503.1 hypothetical protein [Deltaproteobacteria bacterium]MBT6613601.1 hypothetical protein [Deltaproteobacteria bacterium]MBT7713625.1 hypothetical protein [Deltaproteobacteria bacterium]
MNLGFVLLIIIVAGFFGRKRPLLASIFGVVITLAIVLYSQDYSIKSIIVSVLKGISASFAGAYLTYFWRSGLKGGNHNTGPSIGASRGGGANIIHTDEEEQHHKRK